MRRSLSLLLVAACGSTSPGGFSPPFEQTTMVLQTVEPGGRAGTMFASVTGTRKVGAKTLPVVTLERTVGGDPSPVEIIGGHEPGEITLGGVVVPNTDDQIGVELIFDRPLRVNTKGKVGDVETIEVDGELTLGDPDQIDPGYLPFEATTTIVEQDAVAPAAMGDVPGCTQVSVEMSTIGISVDVQAWVRDDRGLVHAEVDSTPFGRFELGPSEWTGFEDAGSRRVIQREAILDRDNPSFSLSTFDVDQDFLANKNVHAKMWLEVRWADADKARTTERPPVTESFGTVFGFFPSQLLMADASVLHPEDADEGFVYWVAFVDQAAKNEPENGIAYSVSATHDGGDPVLAGAFIRYARIKAPSE